jgi:hypothetical protein
MIRQHERVFDRHPTSAGDGCTTNDVSGPIRRTNVPHRRCNFPGFSIGKVQPRYRGFVRASTANKIILMSAPIADRPSQNDKSEIFVIRIEDPLAQPRRPAQCDGLGGSIMSKIKRRTTAKANARPRPIATSNPKLPIADA